MVTRASMLRMDGFSDEGFKSQSLSLTEEVAMFHCVFFGNVFWRCCKHSRGWATVLGVLLAFSACLFSSEVGLEKQSVAFATEVEVIREANRKITALIGSDLKSADVDKLVEYLDLLLVSGQREASFRAAQKILERVRGNTVVSISRVRLAWTAFMNVYRYNDAIDMASVALNAKLVDGKMTMGKSLYDAADSADLQVMLSHSLILNKSFDLAAPLLGSVNPDLVNHQALFLYARDLVVCRKAIGKQFGLSDVSFDPDTMTARLNGKSLEIDDLNSAVIAYCVNEPQLALFLALKGNKDTSPVINATHYIDTCRWVSIIARANGYFALSTLYANEAIEWMGKDLGVFSSPDFEAEMRALIVKNNKALQLLP